MGKLGKLHHFSEEKHEETMCEVSSWMVVKKKAITLWNEQKKTKASTKITLNFKPIDDAEIERERGSPPII